MHLFVSLCLLFLLLPTALSQCSGGVGCTKWSSAKKVCNVPWRRKKCKMTPCSSSDPARKWRCAKIPSKTPSPSPKPAYADVEMVVEFIMQRVDYNLDSAVSFLYKRVGPGCPTKSNFIHFEGDVDTLGGRERYVVKLGKAMVARKKTSGFLTFQAIWRNRDHHNTIALRLMLRNTKTGAVVQPWRQIVVRPAPNAAGCAFARVARAEFQMLPTPSFSVKTHIPTKLFFHANLTMIPGSFHVTHFKSAIEVASSKISVDSICPGGLASFYTTRHFDPWAVSDKVKHSYIVEVSKLRDLGLLGNQFDIKVYGGWTSGGWSSAHLTVALFDNSGRRYPTFHDKAVITPGFSSPDCPDHLVATATVRYSISETYNDVRLSFLDIA